MEKDILTARARNLVSKNEFLRAVDNYQKAADADTRRRVKFFVADRSAFTAIDDRAAIPLETGLDVLYHFADGNEGLREMAESMIEKLAEYVFAPVGISQVDADWRKFDPVIARIVLAAVWRLRGELPIQDAIFVLDCGRRTVERRKSLLRRHGRAVFVFYPLEGDGIG